MRPPSPCTKSPAGCRAGATVARSAWRRSTAGPALSALAAFTSARFRPAGVRGYATTLEELERFAAALTALGGDEL